MTVMTTCVAAFLSAGCGDQTKESPASPPAGVSATPVANDPVLTAAADRVDVLGRAQYQRWYAGLVLDHQTGTMTIYRKPGGDFDEAVRARVTTVALRFRDARMSQLEMLRLVSEIVRDTVFWRGRGIAINGAGPLPDGSGVSVMTDAGGASDSDQLSAHYQARVVAEKGGAVAATAAPVRPSRSSGGSSK
jgi:hypothetical protein